MWTSVLLVASPVRLSHCSDTCAHQPSSHPHSRPPSTPTSFLPAGRLLFELFIQRAPRAAEAFRVLCAGVRSGSPTGTHACHAQRACFQRVARRHPQCLYSHASLRGVALVHKAQAGVQDCLAGRAPSTPPLLSLMRRACCSQPQQVTCRPHLWRRAICLETVRGCSALKATAQLFRSATPAAPLLPHHRSHSMRR
jgi:hypothetical protein